MNGPDLLKACTTNVCNTAGLSEASFACFSPIDHEALDDGFGSTISWLRERHVLCTARNGTLWTLSIEASEDHLFLPEDGPQFSLEKDRNLDSTWTEHVEDGIPLRQIFLDAVEGSITYYLAKQYSVLHLGLFTWLLKSTDDMDRYRDRKILQLRPNLGEGGSCSISVSSLYANVSRFDPSTPSPPGKVVLAPSGVEAQVVNVDENENVTTREPSQTIEGMGWKTSVCKALVAEAMEINPQEERWISVKLLSSQMHDVFVWPARLCFAIGASKAEEQSSDWFTWFAPTSNSTGVYKNPLALAEEWYYAAIQPQHRKDDLISEAATVGPEAQQSTVLVAETPVATSPPFNQRLADQQAAMSGIYPTPPDGFLPQQGAINFASDGQVPATQVTTTGVADDAVMPASPTVANRSTSNGPEELGLPYQPNSDDLFDDVNAMDFTTNEVGDADFDYFDEPDEVPDVRQNPMAPPKTTLDMHGVEEQSQQPNIQVESTQLADEPGLELLNDESKSTDVVPMDVETPIAEHEPSAQDQPQMIGTVTTADKPLSPFSIKERFLPRPIPASTMSSIEAMPGDRRRTSTFGPISFNDEVASSRELINIPPERSMAMEDKASIALPSMSRKQPRQVPTDPGSESDQDHSSDDISYDSATSLSEEDELPPKLPWVTRKRKRGWQAEQDGAADVEQAVPTSGISETPKLRAALASVMRPRECELTVAGAHRPICSRVTMDILGLTKHQLIAIAQLVSEQANSTTHAISRVLEGLVSSTSGHGLDDAAEQNLLADVMADMFGSVEHCGITKLALSKEPPRPPQSLAKTPAGHARQPQREGSMQLGPDCFGLPPPYVRLQRGSDTWEMLPPATDFWTALGLGPANGTKDITAVCVAPDNEDLLDDLHDFMQHLSSAYEGMKLGSFRMLDDPADSMSDDFELAHGVARVVLPEGSTLLHDAIHAYKMTCQRLGRLLQHQIHEDTKRTIVVCMINPFGPHHWATQCLCACFWRLFASYRQPPTKGGSTTGQSDMVLQLIPVSLLASPEGLVLLDSQQMGALALEVYDRCPPSAQPSTATATSSLSIRAAPAVELANPAPKRINFQLTADPPSDLLQEGSVLHLAYTLSADGEWLTVCWVDPTGHHYMPITLCLRGQSFRAAATTVWERTMEIISARAVTWRLFIVCNKSIPSSVQKCWHSIASAKARKQVLHVTLLSVEQDPTVRLTLPTTPAPGHSGFPTPVTTPQSSGMTVSPDASGQTTNPPLTPVPSDAAAALGEADVDAQLIHNSDESWGVLLSAAFAATKVGEGDEDAPLAKGLLLRRGNAGPGEPLEGLGVNVHWDMRIRPGGQVDDGGARHAENTLREVLRMYRNLALLSRLRKLNLSYEGEKGGKNTLLPLHVLAVVRAAEALDGFLDHAL